MASLLLNFVAYAWAIAASAVCFFYASKFWIDQFGRFGAFYGALLAFVISLLGARLLLRLADQVLEPYTGPFDGSIYRAAPQDTVYANWQRYAADIMRDRRYAFYARTRQWDKLAALDAEIKAARAAAPPPDGPPPPARAPRITSMASRLPPEETRRGARRMAETSTRPQVWFPLDD